MKVRMVNVGSGRTNPDLWGFGFWFAAAVAPMTGPAPAPDGTDRHYDRQMAKDEARWAAAMPACCVREGPVQ